MPGVELISSLPAMVFMSSTQLVSPRPTCPPALVEKNGCFALASRSGLIPPPLSLTVRTSCERRRNRRRTLPVMAMMGSVRPATALTAFQYEFVDQQVELRCGDINGAHFVIGVYIQCVFAVCDYIVDDLAEWCRRHLGAGMAYHHQTFIDRIELHYRSHGSIRHFGWRRRMPVQVAQKKAQGGDPRSGHMGEE